ncbi:MAG: hypothetical protein WC382_13005 [Methanoregulaceae archaeon]|jgi:hypothetical protein
MTLLSDHLTNNPATVQRLIGAIGGRCENCSNSVPPGVPVIHIIGSPPDIGAAHDLQKHLLVLCPSCRESFGSGRVEESLQRELVRHRSRDARSRMQEILGYRPRPYVPPGDFSPEAVFHEMIASGALDLCLNGG